MTRMDADLAVTPPATASASASSLSATASPAPSRPPTQLSREQILDATAACLAEVGYDATTIRTIARRLNCAVGSIYRYFTDKRQLMATVTQRSFAPVVENARGGAAISDTVRQYARIAAADESAYRLMFFLAAVGPDDRDDNIVAGIDRRGGRMPTVIVRLIDQWARQLGDVAQARRLWALVHGAVTIGQGLQTILDDVRHELADAAEHVATGHARVVDATPETIDIRTRAAVADDVCLL